MAFNSATALWVWLGNGRAIARQPLNPQPVLIADYPRTGTMHLHSLLAWDSERFAYCDTLMAGVRSCGTLRAQAMVLGPDEYEVGVKAYDSDRFVATPSWQVRRPAAGFRS